MGANVTKIGVFAIPDNNYKCGSASHLSINILVDHTSTETRELLGLEWRNC